LAAGGVKEGLSSEAALRLTTQTVLGAAHMIQATAKHPATLRDQVCTPGGTTIAGLYAMEKGGCRLALMNAVIAATKRSKKLREDLQKPSSSRASRPRKKIVEDSSQSDSGRLKADRKLH
jgi:pyrroline-5-carboxylate reductase